MPRAPLSAWLGIWLGLCTGLLPLHAARPPAGSARIRNVDYVSVFLLGRDCGLTSRWDGQRKIMTLSNATARVEFEADSREFYVNGLRLFLTEPAVLQKKALYISRVDRDRFVLPIFNPSRITDVPGLHTIVIDPGHGGKDEGARNVRTGLLEKTAALDVAKRLAALLTASGYRVVLTRTDDTFVALPDRPSVARREKADLFIAIHFNAIDNPSITGVETFILTPQFQRSTASDKHEDDEKELFPGNAWDEWNAVLGYRMHLNILKGLRGFDRGLKRARWAVLRDLRCPGLLVEGGYLTSDADARKIATAEWRDQFARAIAAGVASYRDALNRPAIK